MEKVDEFFRILFTLTDEEDAAYSGNAEMTQELFNSICDKFMDIAGEKTFLDFITKYQVFLPEYTDERIKELEALPDIEYSDEELKQGWERLCESIRKKYGEDAI